MTALTADMNNARRGCFSPIWAPSSTIAVGCTVWLLIDDSLNLKKACGRARGRWSTRQNTLMRLPSRWSAYSRVTCDGSAAERIGAADPRNPRSSTPLGADFRESSAENLQHVGTLLVAAADRAAEGLADFGGADEGLSLQGGTKMIRRSPGTSSK